METLSGARETSHLAQPTTVTRVSPDEETMPQTQEGITLKLEVLSAQALSWLVSFGTALSYAGLLIVLAVPAERSLANTERRQVPHLSAGGVT